MIHWMRRVRRLFCLLIRAAASMLWALFRCCIRRPRRSPRCYQNTLRLFCAYVANPDYGWDRVCEQRFGTHPAQVFFEWNTATHVQGNEQSPAKRAFTKQELQDFFDHAEDRVSAAADSGRKGWLPAYRDAVMFKLAYSYGLRFNELRHLQTVDFARNPHAREFGRYGVVHVRYGKAKKGSPPKRRSVLTVFDWTPEVITDWLAHGQPYMDDGIDLFPSERGVLVSEDTLLRRFRRYCEDLGLSAGLDLHSLRRSYATHLIEDGWDPMFVQHQMGHEHASTTALYTCVSSDYRIRTLRRVLNATVSDALTFDEESS
jgi:integrase/recombinase XerD